MSNNKETALVFNIQGYSIQDGPGIRTTVFLKGCPLRCKWCCNPESQVCNGDVIHVKSKCVKCFRCVNLCKSHAISVPKFEGNKIVDIGKLFPVIDHTVCADCKDHTCVKGCFESAIEDVGTPMTVDEVMDRILADEHFFSSSGGGVTVSGGEPMMHDKFVAELFDECKKNCIHTAIETTGYVAWEKFLPVLKNTDLVLFDIKHMDPALHKKLTGVSNELIHENLARIVAETEASVVIRIPVIPGANDSDENMEATAVFANKVGVGTVHILPYHRMGMGKYEGLNMEYPLGEDVESPSDERMHEIQNIFQSHHLRCNIGGSGSYN